MKDQHSTLHIELIEHTILITLNRPERLNAANSVMRREFAELWKWVNQNKQIRVAVVTGAGDRAFSVGQDLKETAELGEIQGGSPSSARHHDVWKPVITAVNGMCVGGGLHHVIDSDIVICSSNATFFDTHIAVGQVFALEPIGLTRRIPFAWVMRMMLMGKEAVLTAEQALQIGLVTEVVAPNKLRDRALEMAGAIARGSPATTEASKRAVWEGLNMGLEEAMNHGYEYIRKHRETHPDFMEGVRAFAERREPQWSV